MRYKLLGRSGLRVSELCLGTMTFGEEWGWGASKEDSRAIFDAFVEAGGNYIDTANKYTLGTSEQFVGEFISGKHEKFVVATKYSLSTDDDDPNASGNHRKNMVQAVEASLSRLKTDYIDLYWVHAWDSMTPVEETMRGLDDLVRAGKVVYIGISDSPAWRVSQANMLADLRGWAPFVALQVEYSLIQRTTERDLMPMARALDLAVTPWAVLGGGVLSGKYRRSGGSYEAEDSKRIKVMDKRLSDRNMAIAEEVRKIADRRGVSCSQVAINWVRQHPGVIIPILGSRTPKQVADNLGAVNFALAQDEIDSLNQVSAVDLGFPQETLTSDRFLKIFYGNNFDRIENHRAG
jgi:aryl-alcohol dehydrogenase-like predicted oxidoreductase